MQKELYRLAHFKIIRKVEKKLTNQYEEEKYKLVSLFPEKNKDKAVDDCLKYKCMRSRNFLLTLQKNTRLENRIIFRINRCNQPISLTEPSEIYMRFTYPTKPNMEHLFLL